MKMEKCEQLAGRLVKGVKRKLGFKLEALLSADNVLRVTVFEPYQEQLITDYLINFWIMITASRSEMLTDKSVFIFFKFKESQR